MARAGNIREAQAIMKGFKRQAKKNFAPNMQEAVMQNYSEQVQEVYGALNNAADSEGEEELDQVVEMKRQTEMASAMPRGGGGGGGGGGGLFGSANMAQERNAASMAMPQQQMMM